MPKFHEEQLDTPDLVYFVTREIIRIACLLLLAQLKQKFFLNASELGPLVQKIRTPLSLRAAYRSQLLSELIVWALTTIALSQIDEESAPLRLDIRDSIVAEVLLTDQHPIETAKQILWIDILQSEPASKLSEEVDWQLSNMLQT